MDKLSVVLDKKDMMVTMDGKSLRIDSPEGEFQRVPLGMVGQVVVYGNPRVECNVWRKLSENGIPSLLLPARGKGDGAWIMPGISSAVMVRLAQFRAWSDPDIRHRAAAWAVREKFCAMQHLAAILERECPFIKSGLESLDQAGSVDQIRGIEGNAARQWFALMGEILPGKWKFSGRNRRPPKDPVNALLSLGYTLLFGEVGKAVIERGLDPGIGFLHPPYPGRSSLTLDLMEPLRPGVDAFALSLALERMAPEDFTSGKQEGCRLSKNARGVFYAAWEEARAQWPLPVSGLAEKEELEGSSGLPGAVRAFVNRFVRSWEDLLGKDFNCFC